MTLTREALCSVSYCPEPRNPDWHHCLIDGGNVIHHHHVVSRGMGGSKRRKMDKAGVVPLCPRHHEEVTLHKWTDEIRETSVGRYYVQIREQDAQSWLLASTGEGEATASGVGAAVLANAPALPSPAGAGASGPTLQGWQPPEPAKTTEPGTLVGGGEVSAPPAPPPLSYAERGMLLLMKVAHTKAINVEVAFELGDFLNEDDGGQFSVPFERYFSVAQLANFASVAARVTPYARLSCDNLSFDHYRAVARLHENPREQRQTLERAAAEGIPARALWPAKEAPERPKCWTLEELREALTKYDRYPDKRASAAFRDFLLGMGGVLEWLGERELKLDPDG